MRKLVIGMAVVALLALMAVPAIAVEVEANLDIAITVEAWGAIRFSDAVLTLTVTEPWEDGEHGAAPCFNTKDFTVLSNTNSTLTVTAPDVSQAKNAPGENMWYPVATYDDGTTLHKIGFGPTIRNLYASTSMGWDDTLEGKEAHVSFSLDDIPGNLEDDNAQVQINSYLDSSRDPDALCPPGIYTTHLILTLTTA